MSIFLNFFYVWLLLAIIAIILLYFRKDRKIIFDDIEYMLSSNGLVYGLISLFILYIIFPFTLPYSISYFLKKK